MLYEVITKLPEYTSKIVNVGIQQNGIESAAATVITTEKYDNIVLLLSDDEKEYLDSYYDLLTTEDYDNYKDEYPILETENLYKLNTKDEDVKEKISDILSLPLMMDYMITSGKAAEYGFAVITSYSIHYTKLYEKKFQTAMDEYLERTQDYL